jgi:hypothetical protein
MSSLAAASTRQAFDTVTELTDPGDGTFRGLVSAAWTIGGRPNGGYLLSMAGTSCDDGDQARSRHRG